MKHFALAFSFLITMTAGPLEARSLTEVYGQGQKEYHRIVYKRLFEWFQNNYFNFEKSMTPVEKDYIHHCLNNVASFADPRFSSLSLNYLRLGIRSGAQPVYSLAVACPPENIQGRKKLAALLKQKNVTGLKLDEIFWVEWISDKKELLFYKISSHQELHRNDGMIWKGLHEDEIKELKIPPFYAKRLEGVVMIKPKNQENKDYLLSLKSMDTDSLATQFKEIVPKYFRDLGLIPDQVLLESSGVEWLYFL